MTPVFLDTVGLLAVWDTADQWHPAAAPVFLQLVASGARSSPPRWCYTNAATQRPAVPIGLPWTTCAFC